MDSLRNGIWYIIALLLYQHYYLRYYLYLLQYYLFSLRVEFLVGWMYTITHTVILLGTLDKLWHHSRGGGSLDKDVHCTTQPFKPV